MPIRSSLAGHPSVPTYRLALPGLVIESVSDPDHPGQPRLHTWDGKTASTTTTVYYRDRSYAPAQSTGLARAVRMPPPSKSFGSTTKLISSMQDFLCRYTGLASEAAILLTAFSVATWFVDGCPVAPILYLLGPENEAALVLTALGCLCSRPVLLADVDVAALATLPSHMDATLLISQRNLSERVARILQASSNRNFLVARGNGQINVFGAKAFSADPAFANGIGLSLSLSPARDLLPTLTDASAKNIAADFQARLLRYRMVNLRRVRAARPDLRDFVPALRDEARAWLAPICDLPDLWNSVFGTLLQRSREIEGDRLSDDPCLVAEGALFFCHKADADHFFVRDLTEIVNAALKGRHEGRTLTDKKVGLLLRALGIRAHRVVRGYRISLTDEVRQQIHRIAGTYRVLSVQDGVARCRHCAGEKTD